MSKDSGFSPAPSRFAGTRVQEVFGPEPSAGDEADGPRNLLIHGENLAVMESLLRVYRGRINLIYIDPPFDLGIDLAMQAPVGEGRNGDGDGPTVIEVLAYRDKWGNGREPYAEMMRRRLALMRELLSETGSVYVHCDYRTNAVLRLMLDEIFGRDRLCNEIIWHYQSGGRQRGRFSMKHDTIFLYTRSEKWTFNLEAIGRPRGAVRRNHMKRQVDADGRTSFTIRSAGRIYTYYEDDLLTPPDVWTDISHIQQKDPQRCGYPTQKPEALLERIILASSNPGDLVADFFCGSGTTGVVAQRLGRKWILCDESRPAVHAARKRLTDSGFWILDFGSGEAPDLDGVAGAVSAVPVIQEREGRKVMDIRLMGFTPSLEGLSKEDREALKGCDGLDFVDFWAVDFDPRPGRPFRHCWQAFRTRTRRHLPLESNARFEYAGPGPHEARVMIVDVMGNEVFTTVKTDHESTKARN